MAHFQQQQYIANVKRIFPDYFNNKTVLDAGCLDINGNNRVYFDNCFYIGVDIAFGRNVDMVSEIYKIPFRDGFFDTIISTEVLEHDPTYYLSLNKLVKLLKPGGLLTFTCATEGRPEHGTLRSDVVSSPLTTNIPIWANYYKNLTENDIRQCLDIENEFSVWGFDTNEESKDIYFYGIKK